MDYTRLKEVLTVRLEFLEAHRDIINGYRRSEVQLLLQIISQLETEGDAE